MGQFDLVQKAEEEAKKNQDPNMTYVNDLDELRDILNDHIKKRKVWFCGVAFFPIFTYLVPKSWNLFDGSIIMYSYKFISKEIQWLLNPGLE